MPRCVAVANIYVANQPSSLTLMVDNFLQSLILILIEDQLMLFMFYLEKRKIAACNMLAKLAGLAQEICTLWFQFFGAVFASKGYPF